jgi:hypothetical protein
MTKKEYEKQKAELEFDIDSVGFELAELETELDELEKNYSGQKKRPAKKKLVKKKK